MLFAKGKNLLHKYLKNIDKTFQVLLKFSNKNKLRKFTTDAGTKWHMMVGKGKNLIHKYF